MDLEAEHVGHQRHVARVGPGVFVVVPALGRRLRVLLDQPFLVLLDQLFLGYGVLLLH